MKRIGWSKLGGALVLAGLIAFGIYHHFRRPVVAAPAPAAGSSAAAATGGGSNAAHGPLRLVDITRAAGLGGFRDNTGAYGRFYLPETLGSGVGFIDYNHTGYPSILLLSGRDWSGHRTALHGQCSLQLYRNNGPGKNGQVTFTNVTAAAGLCLHAYAMGVAVGDYNNDGWDDIFVTTMDGNHLYRNNGNGTFTDVTRQAGLDHRGFGTSAAWVPDRHGRLNLFVAQYVTWSRQLDIKCMSGDGVHRTYCTPEAYNGATPLYYRNNGPNQQGVVTFTNVTQQTGIEDPTCKSLGVTLLKIDAHGGPDIFVSNDTQPNKLYKNNGNGTFTEEGVPAGVAYSEDGVARGGMGTDAADYDNSGHFSLVVGNFANQMVGLFHNQGHGLFVDDAPSSSIGQATQLSLTFGAFFFDYNDSGLDSLFLANGHLDPYVHNADPQVHFRESPLLFENIGHGRFRNVTDRVGPDFPRPIVARGAAFADIGLTGNLDILVSTNGGPVHLFYNTGSGNNALRIQTIGTQSNRDGIGAIVRVHTAAGWQEKMVQSAGSYLSSSELPLTFGLGKAPAADKIEIDWPSGHVDRLVNVAAGQFIQVTEGKGITHAQPLNRG